MTIPDELKRLSEAAADGEWFVEHDVTTDGLSRVDDGGRLHGMLPIYGEVHEINLAAAAVNYVRDIIASDDGIDWRERADKLECELGRAEAKRARLSVEHDAAIERAEKAEAVLREERRSRYATLPYSTAIDIPPGHIVVPIEPTMEMRDAGYLEFNDRRVTLIYKAMCAASPKLDAERG